MKTVSLSVQEFKQYFDDIFIELEDKGMSYKLSYTVKSETIFLLSKNHITITINYGYTYEDSTKLDRRVCDDEINKAISYLNRKLDRMYDIRTFSNRKMGYNRASKNSYNGIITISLKEISKSSPKSN